MHAALDLGRRGTELEADLAGASVGLEVEDAARVSERFGEAQSDATRSGAEREGVYLLCDRPLSRRGNHEGGLREHSKQKSDTGTVRSEMRDPEHEGERIRGR